MGRDKPTKVEGTPRGLGLYRRQGREGFFFIKDWSHLAKEFPGAFEHNGRWEEWIKRPDGSLIVTLREAKAYCLRRCAELEQRKLALTQPAISYSGEDLEGIAQSIATKWIKAWQRGTNLQSLDLGLWEIFLLGLQGAKECEAKGAQVKFFFALGGADEIIRLGEEEQKLKRLIWDEGYRPTQEQLSLIMMRFASILLAHIKEAKGEKEAGKIKPPKPTHARQSQTWDGLLKAKESEDLADRTMMGIRSAATRLQKWASEAHKVKLPTSIDSEMALEYREVLMQNESLSISSARKELKYLGSLFAAGVRRKVLEENPFSALPKDRQSAMKNHLATRKTVDHNNVISRERGAEINKKMLCDGKGKKDPSYDIFLLQAMTGGRIQEVAGLRGCDFIKREAEGVEYLCIRITAWEQRGHGALDQRGGLKTLQSDRIVPLPKCARVIWEKHANKGNLDAAFPEERPKTSRQPWGERLTRRMRDKCSPFKSKSWRETLINNGTNSGISYRAVEMVTGKTGESSVVQYTSDDLAVMQRVIDANAEILDIRGWIEASRQ